MDGFVTNLRGDRGVYDHIEEGIDDTVGEDSLHNERSVARRLRHRHRFAAGYRHGRRVHRLGEGQPHDEVASGRPLEDHHLVGGDPKSVQPPSHYPVHHDKVAHDFEIHLQVHTQDPGCSMYNEEIV